MPLLQNKSDLPGVDADILQPDAITLPEASYGASLQQDLVRRTTLFNEGATFEERRHRLEGLVRSIWFARTDRAFALRLSRFLQLMAQNPALRTGFQANFDCMIGEMHSVTLFAAAGVPHASSRPHLGEPAAHRAAGTSVGSSPR